MTSRPALAVSLLTLGDPSIMTGGHLYHRRVAELAPAHGARVEFLSFPTAPFPLPTVAAGRLLRSARAARTDVMLLDSITAPFVTTGLGRLPAPLVAILHQPPGGIDHGRVRRRVQVSLDLRAYRHASRLILASETLLDDLLTRGFPERLLRVVPPGRDVAPRAAPGRHDLRRGRRAAVLCVGNWMARKGQLALLEAVAALPPDTVTVHLVGDTATEPAYAARVRRRPREPGLAGRVVVHGALSPTAVASLYADADMFALPSVREPYGTVYGEAMAAGLPIVGWAAGNLPRLARHGVEGLAVPVGDLRALGRALRDLALDEPRRRTMGEAARRRAATFPTWDETARRLFAELRDVITAAAT